MTSISTIRRSTAMRVGVVLVNFNGWRDTIECLESLLRVESSRVIIVVCDNGSTDGSVAKIEAWARGSLEAPSSADARVARLTRPSVQKPLPLLATTEEGLHQLEARSLPDHGIVLVSLGWNRGFAGGNNPALRWFVAQPCISHAWVLNNDTVVTPTALSAMLNRLSERPDAGLCGCRLMHYHAPGSVQAFGGLTYNHWLGSSRLITRIPAGETAHLADRVEGVTDLLSGASMLATRRFLEAVGLLSEDYFLYGEEMDWAERARRAGFTLAYAHDGVVFHKEGSVIGTSSDPLRRSWLSDFYSVRSRLRLAAKFFPITVPGVFLGLAAVVLNRLRRRQFDRALLTVRLALSIASYRSHRGTIPPHELFGSDA